MSGKSIINFVFERTKLSNFVRIPSILVNPLFTIPVDNIPVVEYKIKSSYRFFKKLIISFSVFRKNNPLIVSISEEYFELISL